MSDFDLGRFYELTGEIQRYLGWLKGNEQVREWWYSYEESLGSRGVVAQGAGYVSTPYETDLWVDYVYIGLPGDLTEDDLRQEAQNCHRAMDQSWKNGVAWADGMAQYLNSLCADLIRPDAAALRSSIETVSAARIQLEGALPVDWTDLDVNSWVGGSSDEFQDTIEEFHSIVRDQYLTYFAHAETIYAAAAAMHVQAQKGLIPLLESVRDGLRRQLEAWAYTGGNPAALEGDPSLDPRVAEVAGVIWDIGKLVPGAGEVVGKVEDVGDVVNGILGVFDVEVSFEGFGSFSMASADSCYLGLTDALQDKYLKPLQDGLDELQASKSGPVLAAQDQISPWLMPDFAGAQDESWTHDQER